jgi:hypothetical protein
MKHCFSTILLTALALLVSCTREDAEVATEPVAKEFVSFRAGESPTRTSVDESGAVSWTAGDEITIRYQGATYYYVADNSGLSTSFSPKTEADRIPVASSHVYTMDATYGNDALPLVQTIAADGTNGSKMPLLASVQDLLAEDDEINLHFSHKASLLRLTFAKEALNFKSITLSGLNGSGDLTLNFPDGLDLSSGPAVVPVVVGAVSTSADEGVLMRAVCADDSEIARVMWAGTAKRLAVGTLIDQPLSLWKTSPAGISSGKELKEYAILVSNGSPLTRFTEDGTPDGAVKLLADVDISSFIPWSPIGANGNQDPGESILDDKILRNEFDGGGHTVSGMSLDKVHDGFCNYGLFGVAAANIHDLNVEGEITIGSGSAQKLNLCVGGLVSTLRPGCSVQRCTTTVAINVQYYGTEALSGSDVVTASSATSHKWQRVGGIAGRCSGNISDCENKGTIKFTNGDSAPSVIVNCHYGGIAGQVCEYGANNVSISNCTNIGTIASQGRISGYSDKHSSDDSPSSVSQVFHGMSLGGIVGTLGHMVSADMTAQPGVVSMNGCTNNGEIGRNYNGAGGNFGGVAGRTGCDAVINITECTNTKSVHGAKTSAESSQTSNNDFFQTMGGVIGACHARGGELSSLTNSGNVYVDDSNTAAIIGGVFGIISTFSGGVTFRNLSNSGSVYTNKEAADTYLNIGGIVGRLWMQKGATPVTLNSPVNTGYIHNANNGKKARIGGLIGLTPGRVIINDGVNKGDVTAWTKNGTSGYSNVCFIGGLIGEIWDLSCELNRCKQYGYIAYNNTDSYHGLIAGYLEGKGNLTASACYAAGSFGLSGGTVYRISSAEDLSSMVTDPSASTSITDGKIPIVALGGSAYYVGTPWEWSYHEVE